ncbi:hypothetical protein [Bacillus sp. CH30_1T]|nr:hypothetical protein [Bacillus sp. CH30_1T]
MLYYQPLNRLFIMTNTTVLTIPPEQQGRSYSPCIPDKHAIITIVS